MAHRGRLNVLAHVLRRPYRDIFAEFEGEHALDVETLRPDHGSGDVKYHHAANTTARSRSAARPARSGCRWCRTRRTSSS